MLDKYINNKEIRDVLVIATNINEIVCSQQLVPYHSATPHPQEVMVLPNAFTLISTLQESEARIQSRYRGRPLVS